MARTRKTFRKVITSPELIEQINPKNKKLMERFLKNFATKRSPASVKNYRSDLNIFMCWCIENLDNKEFTKVRKIEMMDFFDYTISDLKWSPNRFARMHSCLSSFSEWIENYLDDEYPDFRNIVKKVEKPVKENVRKKTVLQQEDINKLFDYFNENGKTQDACLLALSISCGARISEISIFTTDLIDDGTLVFDNLFIETSKEIKTKGRGVNGKMLKKYILKDLFMPHYNKWLQEREKILKENNKEHDFIFIKENGEPMSVDGLRSKMVMWSDIVEQPCYPHNFRHYFVSSLKKLELEDDFIVFIVGWAENSGSTMVQIYNDIRVSERKIKNLDKLKNALSIDKQ